MTQVNQIYIIVRYHFYRFLWSVHKLNEFNISMLFFIPEIEQLLQTIEGDDVSVTQ